MAERPRTRNARRWFALGCAVVCVVSSASPAHAAITQESVEDAPAREEYRFVCDDDGRGLSVVDVLEATGDHATFLRLLGQYDPEGFEILSDPELADKTVWAPTDAAFARLSNPPSSLSDDEVKAILGYHITPPRRTPEGPYPIITPQFLTDGGEIVHQTRTGILTGSDQRVRTRVSDGVLTVEASTIRPTSWCTLKGSVFSIDAVIDEASTSSWAERVIYVVFFKYPYLWLLALGAVVAGAVVSLRRRRDRSAASA